ncbi:MAG: ADP-glyceromanno-heptose 6-epimerase [Bacteroidetes bacterium]|nr:ADP-glyceromanno-heptose 6-epimerase [Bacteroidota bacterium]
MVIVTGAAGFIGSCLVGRLNQLDIHDVVAVDDFSHEQKEKNLADKHISKRVHRDLFFDFIKENHKRIKFIFHLGARTDTTEFNSEIFDRLNVSYSCHVWQLCSAFQIPMLYASSAATYGNGQYGYDDRDLSLVEKLEPLNPYGISKNDFDKWVLMQRTQPPKWAGLKFFNVYGPNEYHKGRMASVVFHAFNQIKKSGSMKLFRSHRADFVDGFQLRDFIYVKDVVDVCLYFYQKNIASSIYNLGTGTARSFLELATATFSAMDKQPQIEWVDIPIDIRDNYQYFTEANMNKLVSTGFVQPFQSLEQGIRDYVTKYLTPEKYF